MSFLADLIRGRAAHRAPVACIEDLPADVARSRIAHVPHTIWQTVWHLNYWMDLEIRAIDGPEPPYPENWDLSWPAAEAPADEAAWRAEVARFETNVERLIEVAESGPEAVARVIHPSRGITVEQVIGVIAAHNSYHLGQIVTIRQALGQWQ